MHGATIAVFEGEMPFADLVKHIEGRLHLIPRYRQRLVFVPFNLHHASWEDDPDFQLENHIKLHTLPPGTSLDEAVKEALVVNEPILDRTRPLWETHVFTGVPDRTLLLTRVHHCMIDGVSSIELSTVLMDFQLEPAPTAPAEEPWRPAALPNAGQLLLDAALDTLQEQLQTLRQNQSLLGEPARLAERTAQLTRVTSSLMQVMSQPIVAAPWNAAPVSRRRAFAWLRYPFSDFRAMRAGIGGTLNDIVLTVATEAAARYLNHHNYTTAGQSLRLMCPVSVRREGETAALGNRVSGMFPTVPASPMDVVERHELVKAETIRIKNAGLAQGLELLIESAPPIPPSLMTTALLSALGPGSLATTLPPPPRPVFPLPQFGYNFVLTNVPGVQVAQYMAGHRCLDQVSPLMLGGNAGYGVVVSTYNQNLYFSLVSDARLLPDIDLMAQLIDDVTQELRARTEAAGSPIREATPS